MTVAVVAFCIGGFLVAGAAIFLLLALGDLRALLTLYRIRPTPIGSRGRVALEGVTEYGTAGRQIAPMTGEDCAWYRVTLLRVSPPASSSDGDGPDVGVLLEMESPAWPTLTDHNARIAVDPRLLAGPSTLFDRRQTEPLASIVTELEYSRAEPVPLPSIVPADAISGLGEKDLLRLTEVRLPRGLPVFALGRATRTGLRPSRAGLTMVTTDTRPAVIADRRESVRMGRNLAVGFGLTGLLLAGAGAAWLTTLD